MGIFAMPRNKLSEYRANILTPLLLFFFFIFLYSYTAAPSVYTGDSGELSAAVNTLGLAHPTGFPLYMLSGHLMIKLFPVHDPAFILNIYSALLTSVALIFIFFALRNLRINTVSSFFSSIVLGFGQTIWFHAGMAGVYPLGLILISILLFIFTKWSLNKEFKLIYWYALILGVSLGTHVLMITMFIPLLFMLKTLTKKISQILKVAILILLPLSQYLYIPLAYSHNKIVNLGQIDSFQGFINYITQRGYTNKIFSRTIQESLLFLKKVLTLFTSEFTIIFIMVAIIGMVYLYKKNRTMWSLILSVILMNIGIMFFYGNNADLSILFRYFFISYAVLVIPIAFCLNWIFSKFVGNRLRLLFFIIFLIIGVFIEFRHSYALDNRRENFVIPDFANNIMKTAESNSIILTITDPVTGPLWYFQSIGVRPDVKIIDIVLLNLNWYVKNEAKRNPDVIDYNLIDIDPKINSRFLALLRQNIDKYKIYAFFNTKDKEISKEFDFLPIGVVNQIVKKGSLPIADLPKINSDNWGKYTLRTKQPDTYKDLMVGDTVEIYSIILSNLGSIYYDAGLINESKKALEKSLEFDPRNIRAQNGLKLIGKIQTR